MKYKRLSIYLYWLISVQGWIRNNHISTNIRIGSSLILKFSNLSSHCQIYTAECFCNYSLMSRTYFSPIIQLKKKKSMQLRHCALLILGFNLLIEVCFLLDRTQETKLIFAPSLLGIILELNDCINCFLFWSSNTSCQICLVFQSSTTGSQKYLEQSKCGYKCSFGCPALSSTSSSSCTFKTLVASLTMAEALMDHLAVKCFFSAVEHAWVSLLRAVPSISQLLPISTIFCFYLATIKALSTFSQCASVGFITALLIRIHRVDVASVALDTGNRGRELEY